MKHQKNFNHYDLGAAQQRLFLRRLIYSRIIQRNKAQSNIPMGALINSDNGNSDPL